MAPASTIAMPNPSPPVAPRHVFVFVVRRVGERLPGRCSHERVLFGAAGSEASFRVTFSDMGRSHAEDLISSDTGTALAFGEAG